MKNLVSVIMPAYNRQSVVGESIESMLSQSYQDWELIITDSGSTDDTLKLCREFAEKDSRIKVIARANSGVSASRNAGLQAAQGEFLFFLDSDDVIHPQLIATLVSSMQQTGASIAGSGVRYVRNQNWHKISKYIEEHQSDKGETEFLSFEKAIDAIFTSTTPINLIGGVMMRKSLVGDTEFSTDLHIGEDFYFMYQNLIKGADVVFLKPLWYFGRLHDTNISHDHSFAGFWSRFHRRELVWQSEEAQGRHHNAKRQKADAFGVFRGNLLRNSYKTPDGKKIRRTMKAYKKEILPDLSFKDKLVFYAAVYATPVYLKALRLSNKFKK